MDTNSFIVFIRTDDISKDIAEDIEIRFGTSNYELNRPCLKDELGGKIMKEFVGLRTKTYS